MIKLFLLFVFLIGVDSKYKCFNYYGEVKDMPATLSQCEGDRCQRFHFTGTPESLSLECSDASHSLWTAEERWENVKNEFSATSVFYNAKREELKIITCSGDLCNKDDNAVEDIMRMCKEKTLSEWPVMNSPRCYGRTCSQTMVGHKVLLGCTDEFSCTEEYMNEMQKKAIDQLSVTGFAIEKDDVKTTCCREDMCNIPEEPPKVVCWAYSGKLTEAKEMYIKGRKCGGEICRYSVGGDRVLMDCANAFECRSQNLETVKENVFKNLSENNPSLKTANDVKTSCCSSPFCNYADKPAAESFAVRCYNYVGETSNINLDQTCFGEMCVTMNYGNRTELSCSSKMFCETEKIVKVMKESRMKKLNKIGWSLTEKDVQITCCGENECNSNGKEPLKDEASGAMDIYSQLFTSTITFVLFY